MNGVYISPQDLERIGRLAGWAPGNYTGLCRECRKDMIADKRAIHCFVCAVLQVKASIDETEAGRLRDIIRRRLACDGSNGRYHAGEHLDLTEEMRAAAR